MKSTREYDGCVQRWYWAPIVVFSLLAAPAALLGRVSGQAKETHSSELAHASGGRAASSVPSAAASGASPSAHVPLPPHNGNGGGHGGHGGNPSKPTGPGHNQNNSQQYVEYGPTMVYGVPVPYAVDYSDTDDSASSDADDNDPNYQGGPTVFDRRGSGEDSYVPPVEDVPSAQATQPDEDYWAATEPEEPTILIFKDGHSLEVENYAIVGATFFDLTPGHVRKIALAELDLPATYKQNDDRGVVFQLPAAMQAN